MKICVFGVGAIGGVVAARLARAAEQGKTGDAISVLARGAQLAAIRARGLRLVDSEGTDITVELQASDDAKALGPQDLVVVALKGHQLPAAAPEIAALLGPKTRVVMVLNGIPWWYFHGMESAHRDRQLPLLDPDGALWKRIGPDRVIGCVAYCSARVDEPGVVRQNGGRSFALGEPSGVMTEDLKRATRLFDDAGLNATASPRIRDEIWGKLLFNAAINPTSALIGCTSNELARDPGVAGVLRRIMTETYAVGRAHGARVDIDIDGMVEGAKHFGANKSSMLQDMERGRPLEVDGILGAVVALGKLADVPTPTVETILALVSLRGRIAARQVG
ncbi:MAG: ketopantoate reductase family protein [Candidatus Eiseniibacteriota bacterium]